MRAAGYDDIQRGQRGSTEEHLTITQFKVRAEQERLEAVEHQTQEALSRLDDLLPELEQGKRLAEELSTEPESFLPPPKRLESAKSYRERIKPIWEKIVRTLRSIFNSYVKLKHEVQTLRSENRFLRTQNKNFQNIRNRLDHRVEDLEQENHGLQARLRDIVRDFDRAKKILGDDAIDQAITTAKAQETAARKPRRRSRDYER